MQAPALTQGFCLGWVTLFSAGGYTGVSLADTAPRIHRISVLPDGTVCTIHSAAGLAPLVQGPLWQDCAASTSLPGKLFTSAAPGPSLPWQKPE